MSELHRVTVGKITESLVLARMLESGLEVFEATADVRGVDFVVRAEGGAFVEVQVKGVRTEKDREWFQLQTREGIEALKRRAYFVIGVSANREFWVFPPEVFFEPSYVNISTNEKGTTTVDLNLATTRRGADTTNRDRVGHLRDAWNLLSERSLKGATAGSHD